MRRVDVTVRAVEVALEGVLSIPEHAAGRGAGAATALRNSLRA